MSSTADDRVALSAKLPALLIVAAVAVAYASSLNGTFVFDDYGVIVDYPPVHSFAGWLHDLPRGIRPLLKLTYLLNWLSGPGAAGFHLFNVAIHAVNALLVYRLAARAAERWQEKSPAGPLVAALLFAVHPVQTEAVAYISGRSSSLMTLFFLASILAYLRGVDEKSAFWRHGVSVLLYLLAVAVKETALVLPLVLFLAGCTLTAESRREILKGQALHYGIFGAVAIAVTMHPRYARLLWISMDTRSLHDNILSQINGVAYLLERYLFVNSLNIDPDLPVLRSWSPDLAGCLALLAGILAFALVTRRTRPWILFGVLWFFLLLLPSNSILPRLDIANERHLYPAGIGLFLIAGMEGARLRLLEGIWGKAATVLLLILLAVFTTGRNLAYRSNVTLWEETARLSPNKSRVCNNLGLSYEREDSRDRALSMYRKAVALDPKNVIAWRNLIRLRESAP